MKTASANDCRPNAVLPPDPFATELDTAYTSFRVALVSLLRDSGADPRSGTSIASVLKINRQMAWQFATIAAEPTCATGLKVLPGSRGVEALAQACARCDIESKRLDALKAAVDELDRAINRHAGDRASLNLFAAAWQLDGLEARTESLRRDGYRAQSALLGIRASTQIRGLIFAPSVSGDPDFISRANYQCLTDLTRLRRDRPCRIAYIEAPTHDDGSPAMLPDDLEAHVRSIFAVDASLTTGDASEVEYIIQGNRAWVTLRPGYVGRTTAARWIFTGAPDYQTPRYRSDRDAYNQVSMITYVPTDTMHIDVLMDRSMVEHVDLADNTEVNCFDAASGNPMRPVSVQDPAFLYEMPEPKALGEAELACDADVPNMAEIVDAAARRINTSIDRLVGVRFSSMYAMTPCAFVVSRSLPSDRAGRK